MSPPINNSKLAHIGSARKDEEISGNLCRWVFSNPFTRNGRVAAQEPAVAQGRHALATINPNTPLMVDGTTGISFTWQDVYQASLSLAAGIIQLPLRPPRTPRATEPQTGAVVLVCLPNCIQFPIALFGILSAGYTVTMASTGLTATELTTIIEESRTQLVFTTPENRPKIREALAIIKSTSIPIYTISPDSPDLNNMPRTHADNSWQELMLDPLVEPIRMDYAQASQHVAVILWSSGTSGKPKGIIMTHQAFIASIVSLWHVNPHFSEGERWMGVVPFYHIFGLFEPTTFLDMIPKHAITCLHMAPPVALLMAKNTALRAQDFASVRNALCGGAPVAWNVVESIHKRLGLQIRMGYGLSEAGSVSNQVVLHGDISDHKGHVGIPLYGVELKITDTSNANITVAVGNPGRILVRSGGMMKGYLDEPKKTREALDEDGWFDTGDLGIIDEKGRLHITGRLKDVIKVRGFQVSPAELEDIILALPFVADVAVAAVCHEERGTELPRAYVVPTDTQLRLGLCNGQTDAAKLLPLGQDIRACVEKSTIHYKWLKGNIVFLDSIPKSLAGKILRKDLSDKLGVLCCIYEDGLGKRTANL
ncbi:hypothetical protein VHEMI04034 [[Torrubiella] hemipterigena]|uniref:AMP-dependent synthetase/ligase domain-containing protein n=1 Tax=[Torrubiella] hemipterigena TaxID=1531966 RepID=A0A0A1TCN2_9HYPO|nr:hypothetical protein VHEMI04034 [[Torrubiella] hemipterigena]